ncbi:MAG TPA: helix-turn-helix domain-containing protein [Pseudonocardia sp.]
MARVAADPETRAGVRTVAVALLPESPQLGVELAALITARVPEFTRMNADSLVVASCQANSNALLDGLIRNVPMHAVAPTVEVRQLTRALVQHGLTLAAVMRGYRLGAQHWTELWAEAVRAHLGAGKDAVAVVQAGTSFVLGWLDEVSERLAEEYHDEAERLTHERSLAQVEDVRRALTDPGLDIAATSARLGYDLARRHLALVLRHESGGADAGAAVRRLCAAIGGTIGGTPPLIVRVDMETTWCWLRPSGGAPHRAVPDAPLVAAQGRPGRGLTGFRASHHEALAALRVADLARCAPGTLTRYDDVAIAAVCSADPDWCRTFVRTELGALAADDDTAGRIRATLEEFFAANCNFRATAARLGVHHNTVRYRLERAEQMLARPPTERRLALELALHLAARLGPRALESEDGR